jgi:hypothetical protein
VPRAIDRAVTPGHRDRVQPRASKNLRYLGALQALRAFYTEARMPRVSPGRRPVLEAALANLDLCIEERRTQLERFLGERGATLPPSEPVPVGRCPLPLGDAELEHVAWVRALPEEAVAAGIAWLSSIVDHVAAAGASLE